MAALNAKIGRWSAALVPAVLGAAAVVAACSGNNSSNPQPPVYSVEGGAGQDASVDVQQQQDGSSQDAGSEGQAEAAPPEDAAACTADSGCWSCTPQTPTEFLNQCTSSQCSPFVNAQRLPDYDGSLPPLQ